MKTARAIALIVAVICFMSEKASAITAEEVAQYIGKQGAVDGMAVQVSQSDGNVYVNFGAKYPNQVFTAFVAKADVPAIGLDYLKSLEGKPVSVVGRITKMKGKPEIRVTKRDQIIVTMSPKAASPP